MAERVKKEVVELTSVWLSLARSGEAETMSTLADLGENTIQLLLDELPVSRLKRTEALRKGAQKRQKEERETESKSKKREKKAEQAKEVAAEKRRQHYAELKFAEFYSRAKESMLKVLYNPNGTVVHVLMGVDLQSLESARSGLARGNVADFELEGTKKYLHDVLISEKSMNSLAFSQGLVMGKRFWDVFHDYREKKQLPRFIDLGWASYGKYLKVVAPGMPARKERNLRRMYELSRTFPCIKLISSCTLNEFWTHMRAFRDMLERSDEEALLWRCPVRAGGQQMMQFQFGLEYAITNDQNAPTKFGQWVVQANAENPIDFLRRKNDYLKAWREDDNRLDERLQNASLDCDDELVDEEDEMIESDGDGPQEMEEEEEINVI